MKNIFFYFFFILLSAYFLCSCKKEFDMPPVKRIGEGAKITIAQIKMKYNPYNIYKFRGDTNLYCVVTADEVSGNLYKDIFVKDATGGLHIKLISSGGLFIGDSIRINLNNINLNSYSDLIQLDSVDVVNNVVKLASGLKPEPEMVTIPQLIENTTAGNPYQSRLIKLNNVEFIETHRKQPYANAVAKAVLQYTLQDCNNRQITIRTSGFCYFASQLTPEGNGSIVAIVSQFNNTMQLIIRTPDEVKMTGPHCVIVTPTVITSQGYLLKNFEDGSITSGDWTNINATGTVNWAIKTSTNNSNPTKVAECNNFLGSGNQPACETWLISPPVDLSGSSAPTLSFTSTSYYSGPPLQTFISINYISGAPSTATWTELHPTYGTGSNHVASGNEDLSAYKISGLRVAFKYTGNIGSGQRWQIDNIRIGE